MIDQGTAQAAAQQPQNWMQLVYMSIMLIAVNLPLWIREIKKYKDFKAKNGTLDVIKSGIQDVKSDIGKLQTGQTRMEGEIKKQANACKLISGPLKEQVEQNKQNLFDLVKDKKSS